MIDGIRFSETKDVPAPKLHTLFVKEQWNDWLDLDEVAHYISISLHIVTAWHGDELIGTARLAGDGRLCSLRSTLRTRTHLLPLPWRERVGVRGRPSRSPRTPAIRIGAYLDAELTDVLVRSESQGQGIGTELARRAAEEIRRLDPYKAWVEPMGEREIHIYGKLGFGEVSDYRIMEMNSPRLMKKIAEVRGQQHPVGQE